MKSTKLDTHMNDRELLLEAIDNYPLYTSSQRILLKTLVNINLNNMITTNIKELSKISGLSNATIYTSIKLLIQGGIVEKIKGPTKGMGILKLIPSQLEEIKNIYNKKRELLKNN